MQTIKSELWKLSTSDIVKGLKVAVFTAFVSAVYAGFKVHGVDFHLYDWHMILDNSVTAGVGYLLNKFSTDSEGKTFGKI